MSNTVEANRYALPVSLSATEVDNCVLGAEMLLREVLYVSVSEFLGKTTATPFYLFVNKKVREALKLKGPSVQILLRTFILKDLPAELDKSDYYRFRVTNSDYKK